MAQYEERMTEITKSSSLPEPLSSDAIASLEVLFRSAYNALKEQAETTPAFQVTLQCKKHTLQKQSRFTRKK